MTEHTEAFDRFAIVGLGLIGGSIAKDLRSKFPEASIVAVDPNESSVREAIDEGVIDDAVTYRDLPDVAQVTFLAPPIDYVAENANQVFNAFNRTHQRALGRYVILDTASVKAPIAAQFEDLTARTDGAVEFVASHPMAGTEYSGFRHARKDLFRAKPWIICPHPENQEETITAVSSLLHDLGAKVRRIDASEHDRQAALVSHSVIMLSNIIFDYVATNHPEALELAGDGFISTTRLASGNPELHKSIIQNNTTFTEAHLKGFSEFLADKITNLSTDGELLLGYFKKNMDRRNGWLRRRK
ncbi:MAG TPA: prephenate dehydrogenase/arogenate dehydrogenase family protein [Candidatus Saccharimonadales bacterium]